MTPTIQDIEAARQAFEANEPRDLFYRAATELVALALDNKISFTVGEALAVLLQTWNKMFYRYRRFDSKHLADIERLVSDHCSALLAFRQRSIESFTQGDETKVVSIFHDFEDVLGPVGAAKCLHLMAPSFFPLWDRAIAKAYGLPLKSDGRNGERYCRLMSITKEQVRSLGAQKIIGQDPLKAIDEFNYCKYTKRWI